MSNDGIRQVRGKIIAQLKWAVADGTIDPHEAAVVLSSTLSLMVAAIRDEGLRNQYLSDLMQGFPVTVELARFGGAEGMTQQ